MAGSARPLALVLLVSLLVGALPIAAAADARVPILPAPSLTLQPHAAIRIVGDLDFRAPTDVSGVVSGSGRPGDPYVIEGWDIWAYPNDGIWIEATTAHFIIRDVRLAANWRGGYPGIGVVLHSVQNGRVTNATFDGTTAAVDVVGSSGIRIDANVVPRDAGRISVGSSDSVTIESNLVQDAIYLEGTTDSMVRGNEIVAGGYWGIVLNYGSGRDLVEANTISGAYNGVTVNGNGALPVTVRGNTITGSEWADVYLDGAEGVDLEGNVLGGRGVVLRFGDAAMAASHTMTPDNLVGGLPLRYEKDCSGLVLDGVPAGQVLLARCTDVLVANLTLANVTDGILLAGVDRGIVAGNAFLDGFFGIILGQGTANVSVFHNDFLGTIFAPVDEGANAWDGGYPAGGNYWWRYTGPDACRGPLADDCTAGDGLGDVPLALDPDSVDRYPLRAPFTRAAEPPTAAFGMTPPTVNPGDSTYLNATVRDPDGVLVEYLWDYGDGVVRDEHAPSTWHAWSLPGTYPVTLRVTDNSGLTANATLTVTVLRPRVPPAPILDASSYYPYEGEAVSLNGSRSYAPYGQIVRWDWTFGDGEVGSGPSVLHRYDVPGPYQVTLTVTDDLGEAATAVATIVVLDRIEPPPIQNITLVPYGHAAGFRLLVPEGWTRDEDVVSEGTTLELILTGPTYNIPTTIVIETDVDWTVRETPAYLADVAADAVAEMQAGDPTVYLAAGPEYRTVGGHAAVLFEVGFGTTSYRQRFAVVVSEAHGRFWILLLSVDLYYYPTANAAFEAMLDSFEITLAASNPQATSLVILSLIGGLAAAGAAAGVLAFVLVRRRGRGIPPPTAVPSPGPQGPAWPISSPPSRPAPAPEVACPGCSTLQPSAGRFCIRCGSPMASR